MVRRSVWQVTMSVLCAGGLALACASTPETEKGETDLGGTGGGFQSQGGGGAAGGGAAAGAVVGVQDAETARLQAGLDAVYFDYDRSTLRADAAAKLKEHAEVMRGFPAWANVTVEGHCDERGTEEYNLALGDRRADAVKRYLVTLGVPGDKIRTVSYGELKPKQDGHDESAWQWNRRAEFQVSK
jgi:peptidoglycan-associated lipoprotein